MARISVITKQFIILESMEIDRDILNIRGNNINPKSGELLIAEPFLQDFPFSRSVILVINHTIESSMGIILNMPIPQSLNEIIPEFKDLPEIPLFRGGPLGDDILFFVHTRADIPSALPITDNLFLNGDFQTMKEYITSGLLSLDEVRFFLGYTGWGPQQLNLELKENTWLLANKTPEYILKHTPYTLWKDTLSELGPKQKLWSRFPSNPSYN